MSNTDYVARAKALLKSQARAAALVIVPLAAAVSAHALPLVTLPAGGFTCTYSANDGSGGSCASGSGVGLISGGGLSFFLSSGGVALDGGGNLQELTKGAVTVGIGAGATIPYSYDIGLFVEQIDPTWTLEIGILDVTTDTVIVQQTFSGSYGLGANTLSGSGDFTALGSTSFGDDLEVAFSLTASAPENALVTFTIPEGESVDLGPVGSASTPEPASVGLLGGGLAWLAFRWRKRRKNQLPS